MPDPENDALQRALIAQLGGPQKQGASDTPPAWLPGDDVSTKMPVGGPDVTPQATATPPAVQPSVFQGFTPKHAMEGFNFNREQNTGKSAKDAFAYLANQAPPPPLNDKAALGQWFNQYIKPGMDALGHTVTDVNGDTFHFKNWQGDFTVDYGRGAGADNGALAWQVQDDAQPAANATYTPRAMGTLQPKRDTSAIDRIQQEIQALQNGAGSPMDQRALEDLLRL